MPERVIRLSGSGHRVENDVWRVLGLTAEEDLSRGPLPNGPVIVPLALWKERAAGLRERREPLGVWLKPDEDPADIAADLDRFSVVAVHFPKFTDGRGYSTAALLRNRHGYRGELRAIGDVGRDQLYYLARVGFDAFRLPDARDPEAALASLDAFTVRYQGSVDDPLPLFRRRSAAGAPR
jgi:uncharacterized protein (DUF934 family)